MAADMAGMGPRRAPLPRQDLSLRRSTSLIAKLATTTAPIRPPTTARSWEWRRIVESAMEQQERAARRRRSSEEAEYIQHLSASYSNNSQAAQAMYMHPSYPTQYPRHPALQASSFNTHPSTNITLNVIIIRAFRIPTAILPVPTTTTIRIFCPIPSTRIISSQQQFPQHATSSSHQQQQQHFHRHQQSASSAGAFALWPTIVTLGCSTTRLTRCTRRGRISVRAHHLQQQQQQFGGSGGNGHGHGADSMPVCNSSTAKFASPSLLLTPLHFE
jgi:hypothetical protein